MITFCKPETLEKRLLRHRIIDEGTGCWLWSGAKLNNGYGRIGYGYVTITTHQASAIVWLKYDLTRVSKDYQINHKTFCPNRHCFNPAHIYIGSQKENAQDAFDLGTRIPWGKKKRTEEVRNQIKEEKNGG